MENSTPRAVVTGIGAITALGLTADDLWKNLLAGKSGIGRIESFDATGHAVQIAGEVKEWSSSASSRLDATHLRRLDRGGQMAMGAAIEAFTHSGLVAEELGDRLAVIYGTGVGGLDETVTQGEVLASRGPKRVSPHFISKIIPNSAAGHIAIHFGARGPVASVSTACATGASAIGDALSLVRSGRVDAAICGSVESVVTPLALAGFSQMKGLSTRNAEPHRASRPFDRDRDGFVLAEGAAALVIESLDHAKARNAHILAELVGVGVTCDAYHIAAPRPDGAGILSAVNWCLRDAKLSSKDVGYVNAHATGTPQGDVCELRALEGALGEAASSICVSSTKGQLGHLLGGSGSVEAVISIFAVRERIAPPCTNCDSPEETTLRLIRDKPAEYQPGAVLSTSFGFGGHNVCLAFRTLLD